MDAVRLCCFQGNSGAMWGKDLLLSSLPPLPSLSAFCRSFLSKPLKRVAAKDTGVFTDAQH